LKQEDLNCGTAKWLRKYNYIIGLRKPEVSCYDPNSYNYRYDTLGREGFCHVYRSGVFYIQLSPRINTKIIEMALKKHIDIYTIPLQTSVVNTTCYF